MQIIINRIIWVEFTYIYRSKLDGFFYSSQNFHVGLFPVSVSARSLRVHDGNKLSRLVCSCWFLFLWRIFRRDSWLVEHRTRDRKVASSNPGWSGGRIFFSRVSFVCWLLFGVRSNPVLTQWHVKDPSHSVKSTGGRLHLNMQTPLTERCRSGLTMPLSRHSVGSNQETSSHATRQGTLGHSRLSSLSYCGLILA